MDLTKPNTSHGYNLRPKPGSVAIPKSGTQRHTNSFIAKASIYDLYIFYLLFIRIVS